MPQGSVNIKKIYSYMKIYQQQELSIKTRTPRFLNKKKNNNSLNGNF